MLGTLGQRQVSHSMWETLIGNFGSCLLAVLLDGRFSLSWALRVQFFGVVEGVLWLF